MGCGASGPQGTEEERAANAAIEQALKKDRVRLSKEVKLLLLGAGESGKSTIAKQMKIIHLDGFTEQERASYKSIIVNNIVSSARALIGGAKQCNCNISAVQSQAAAISDEAFASGGAFSASDIATLKALWADAGIQEAYTKRAQFQLNDSTEFYFNRLDAIGAPNWLPDEQDVLRSRVKTTGIIETEFQVKDVLFKMVDVGGQRSERKKWMHCFADVTAVIYCAALSEYDQVLYEDDTTNRMIEAVNLFAEVTNNKWFTETSMILFLNKKDLFAEKIQKVDLKVCWPEYEGGCNEIAAAEFIQNKFLEQNQNPNKTIYFHRTCATDTGNVRVVFEAVKDILLQSALANSGF